MEQRAPRLASAGKILGTLIIIATAINLKLDLLEKPGLSLEEYITISVAFIAVSYTNIRAHETLLSI